MAEVEERLSQHSLTLHSSVNRASYFSVVLREMTKLRVTVSQPRTDGISELAAGPVRLVVARRQEEAGLPLQYCGSAYGRGYDVTATVEAAQEGLYVLYAKAGCDKPTLLLESRGQVQLEQTGKVPGFLESVFQHHAQLSARKLPFRDSRDWVCSELLLREAGLGYFASYVAEDSPRSVKVSYSLASLREGLMVLKGEQAEQQLEHTFGRGRGIILAKVQWELERAARVYKFPPQDMLVESQVETD